MSEANFDEWADPSKIGGLLKMWAENTNRP